MLGQSFVNTFDVCIKHYSKKFPKLKVYLEGLITEKIPYKILKSWDFAEDFRISGEILRFQKDFTILGKVSRFQDFRKDFKISWRFQDSTATPPCTISPGGSLSAFSSLSLEVPL